MWNLHQHSQGLGPTRNLLRYRHQCLQVVVATEGCEVPEEHKGVRLPEEDRD